VGRRRPAAEAGLIVEGIKDMSAEAAGTVADLRDVIRRFIDRCGASVPKAPEPGTTPADPLWRRAASELGLQGIAITEEYGGAGLGITELAVVVEELGRTLCCPAFFSTAVLGATALSMVSDGNLAARWLPAIADGSARVAVAVGEGDGSWSAPPRTVAEVTGTGWRLHGHKAFVLDGEAAGLLVISARTPEGTGLFAVDADAPGLRREAMRVLDLTRPQARLRFDGTPAQPLGHPRDGAALLKAVRQTGTALLCVEQAAGADRALRDAVAYAGARRQFGRVIGSFQAVKHQLADMLMATESARALAGDALDAAAANPGSTAADLPLALAAAHCSRVFIDVSWNALHLHGGIGFTWEQAAHLFVRRAQADAVIFGDMAEPWAAVTAAAFGERLRTAEVGRS
jgi:alkylation response protein AidB-like acyl-CoA dehydrogenase